MTASWDGTPCRIIGAKPQNTAYPGQRGLSWERRRALEMHMSDLVSSNISSQGRASSRCRSGQHNCLAREKNAHASFIRRLEYDIIRRDISA